LNPTQNGTLGKAYACLSSAISNRPLLIRVVRYLPQVQPWSPPLIGQANAFRPFVLGRKNWLFADPHTPAGAHVSASLYSLIEAAKVNDLEPYRYLRHIFKELPKAQSVFKNGAAIAIQYREGRA